LGTGDVIERNEPVIARLSSDLQIVQVAAGNELTLILTDENEVYICGFFDTGPNSGLGLKKITELSGQKVSRIFVNNGCEHIIALTSLGKLWVFGYNTRGQLGLGNNSNTSSPTKLEYLARKVVRTVGTSYYHTVIACEELETYACGRNDSGQFGLGASGDVLTPSLVEDLNGHMVISIGCGQHHSILATAAGQVFACGKNENGQLGVIPHQAIVKRPLKVEGIEARQVACGYYHTLAIGNDKKVYAWGKNDSGQLGLGDRGRILTPTAIEKLENVLQIACGCYHSLVLTSIGLYAFGRNNHGQLGIKSNQNQIYPMLVIDLVTFTLKK
jgi:RCC1 and BTB domain-containing protein